MTEANRRRNILEDWEFCQVTWQAAELLRSEGFFRKAVPQYYYAAFYSARAALLSRGLEPRTHEGVNTLFSRHFVKTGLLPPGASRVLGRLLGDRQEADYSRAAMFSEDDASAARMNAVTFIRAIGELLKQEGWLAAEAWAPE